jgi:tRNA pseudouridine55 synthase
MTTTLRSPDPAGRTVRRPISGVLLLDKPFGLSSNAALQRTRHLLQALKAGHTGTLDPHASGLLPICLGEATKFSSWLLDAPKTYQAMIRLGYRSTTGDGEGEIAEGTPFRGDHSTLDGVLGQFVGRRRQVPPMHSALKFEGRPLYHYARAGMEVPRAARDIVIESIEVQDWQNEVLTISVRASKGTYIRVLAQDIGEALGCGGYLSGLRRTGTGPFTLEGAVTLEQLQNETLPQRESHLLPVDALLPELPRLDLDATDSDAIRHGRDIPWKGGNEQPGQRFRVYSHQSRFLGLCEITAVRQLHPARLMAE